MTGVSWRVPAKVNLSLAVGPRRPDGFHDLATVFHAISLADVVTASPRSDDDVDDAAPVLSLVAAHDALDVTGVPTDATNLAVRAAMALAGHLGRSPAVTLHIEKALPVAGGLAGGSADAAGALLACNDLWDAGLSTAQLCRLAADLGSDVPFAVTGGTAVGTGRGEILDPLPVHGDLSWVIVAADEGLSTPTVYRRLDELRAAGRVRPPAAVSVPPMLAAALADGDVERVADELSNDLQAPAVDLSPGLATTLAAGRAAGALAGIVSGSGPTCVFLASSAASAHEVAEALESEGYAGRVTVAAGPRTPRRVV